MTAAFDQLLAVSGMTAQQLGTPPANLDGGSIPMDADVARVLSLPRRDSMSDQELQQWSSYCRLQETFDDGSPVQLWMDQATAIRDALRRGGLFAPMPVGSGKTLITLLLPTLTQAQRPVLIVPANLREKTKRQFAIDRRFWRVRLPKLISYQELGRPDRHDLLDKEQPDLLELDEAQWVRNLDASVTRRVQRYIEKHQPMVVALSGTLITDDLRDTHATAVWALRGNAPIALTQAIADQWASALSKSGSMITNTGALDLLPGGFWSWFRGTEGVAASNGSECGASIEISWWAPLLSGELHKLIQSVAVSGMRPDGELLDEWELPDCLCQLALGFFYRWDPRPPDWWLGPRRAWRAYVRYVLDFRLPHFDSEGQIVQSLDAHGRAQPQSWTEMLWAWQRGGTIVQPPDADDGRAKLAAWREVREKFEPNPVPVWLDSAVMQQASEWARAEPGIVWVRHRAAGWALQSLGIPYYGGDTEPEQADPNTSIACSIKAHGEGKNLQAWHRMLVTCPLANALGWEQLIGREHRPKQKADIVEVDIINVIPYHNDVMGRVLRQARAIAVASGFRQKLTSATWV